MDQYNNGCIGAYGDKRLHQCTGSGSDLVVKNWPVDQEVVGSNPT